MIAVGIIACLLEDEELRASSVVATNMILIHELGHALGEACCFPVQNRIIHVLSKSFGLSAN